MGLALKSNFLDQADGNADRKAHGPAEDDEAKTERQDVSNGFGSDAKGEEIGFSHNRRLGLNNHNVGKTNHR